MKDSQKALFRCSECDYTVEVSSIPQSFLLTCQRCNTKLVKVSDKSQIKLDKYDEGLAFWITTGCPDCYCEEIDIDYDEDQVCCECLRPECGNYDVFIHEDAT